MGLWSKVRSSVKLYSRTPSLSACADAARAGTAHEHSSPVLLPRRCFRHQNQLIAAITGNVLLGLRPDFLSAYHDRSLLDGWEKKGELMQGGEETRGRHLKTQCRKWIRFWPTDRMLILSAGSPGHWSFVTGDALATFVTVQPECT